MRLNLMLSQQDKEKAFRIDWFHYPILDLETIHDHLRSDTRPPTAIFPSQEKAINHGGYLLDWMHT